MEDGKSLEAHGPVSAGRADQHALQGPERSGAGGAPSVLGGMVTSRAASSRAPIPSPPTRAHPRSSRRTGGSRHQGTQARGLLRNEGDGSRVPDSGHLVHGSEAGGKEEGGAAERNRLRWGPTHPPPLKPFNGSQISGEV